MKIGGGLENGLKNHLIGVPFQRETTGLELPYSNTQDQMQNWGRWQFPDLDWLGLKK